MHVKVDDGEFWRWHRLSLAARIPEQSGLHESMKEMQNSRCTKSFPLRTSQWSSMGAAGATEGDVVHDRDGGRKKRRFWRKFWRKRSQDEREEHTIHQNTSSPSTADALDPSPPPAADIHEEEDENKDEGKKKKKFWKRLWRKGRRGAQSESEEESDRSPEDQIQHNLETPELLNEDVNVFYEINSCQYEIGELLSKAGNTSVYEATRVSDGLKVAVKIVWPGRYSDRICIPGHPNPLPREIGLHILANEGEDVPEIIRLLDWEGRDDKYIMLLEHPSPCMDLRAFIECHGGAITEKLEKSIMRQAIEAVIQCFIRGVFHMDIKLENFLINTETFHIKLIDFGDLLKKTSYKTYMGMFYHFRRILYINIEMSGFT
ncbi:uncharacterized protein LOC130436776 [Triplophysa dalaica]|uniref:uncharacterized protein LOC130436776 n=1 Tax=Triplophysa dalaica TaxID=1582913 RepID=UPI0024E02F33|nr:uncharacterized protein LOC130436776 [Triplophysa dalaica]